MAVREIDVLTALMGKRARKQECS